MRFNTTKFLAIAALALGSAVPAFADTLKEGTVACRSETAVRAFEEFEQTGDDMQKGAMMGAACLYFDEDMEVTQLGQSPDRSLIRIRITNGRRQITLWTRPQSLVSNNMAESLAANTRTPS